eukprot:351464-Chlamydomonas_euryale.AAC.1
MVCADEPGQPAIPTCPGWCARSGAEGIPGIAPPPGTCQRLPRCVVRLGYRQAFAQRGPRLPPTYDIHTVPLCLLQDAWLQLALLSARCLAGAGAHRHAALAHADAADALLAFAAASSAAACEDSGGGSASSGCGSGSTAALGSSGDGVAQGCSKTGEDGGGDDGLAQGSSNTAGCTASGGGSRLDGGDGQADRGDGSGGVRLSLAAAQVLLEGAATVAQTEGWSSLLCVLLPALSRVRQSIGHALAPATCVQLIGLPGAPAAARRDAMAALRDMAMGARFDVSCGALRQRWHEQLDMLDAVLVGGTPRAQTQQMHARGLGSLSSADAANIRHRAGLPLQCVFVTHCLPVVSLCRRTRAAALTRRTDAARCSGLKNRCCACQQCSCCQLSSTAASAVGTEVWLCQHPSQKQGCCGWRNGGAAVAGEAGALLWPEKRGRYCGWRNGGAAVAGETGALLWLEKRGRCCGWRNGGVTVAGETGALLWPEKRGRYCGRRNGGVTVAGETGALLWPEKRGRCCGGRNGGVTVAGETGALLWREKRGRCCGGRNGGVTPR